MKVNRFVNKKLFIWRNKVTVKELGKLSKEDLIKYYDNIEISEPSNSINTEGDSLEDIISEYSESSMSEEDKNKLHEDLKSLF